METTESNNESSRHKQRECSNCEQPLEQSSKFCPACGQPTRSSKITVKELSKEFIQNVLKIDSKLLNTVKPLFLKPGFLTTEFLSGRRQSYYSPGKLFVFFTVLHFAFMQFAFSLGGGDFFENLKNKDEALIHQSLFCEDLAAKTQDSVLRDFLLQNCPNNDSIPKLFLNNGQFADRRDAYRLTFDEFAAKYDLGEGLSQFISKQDLRAQLTTDFNKFLLGRFSWVIFLMMPLVAWFLKLMYRKPKRFFIEHLIFTFHLHTFVFALLSLIYLVIRFLGDGGFLLLLLVLPLWGLYGLVAARKVYQQGYALTLIKGLALGIFYIVAFLLCSIVFVTLTLFLF